MITVTTSLTPLLTPKEGDAFEFAFVGGTAYTCLVIASGRVVVIERHQMEGGWQVGHLTTLGETWNAPGVTRKRIFTKVTINLEP